MSENDILRNPNDPLLKAGPEAEVELLRRLGTAAHGFPSSVVLSAAINLVINVIRQTEATRKGAEAVFDEVSQKAKGILLDQHYEVSGKRKNIFPFDQGVTVPLSSFRQRFGDL